MSDGDMTTLDLSSKDDWESIWDDNDVTHCKPLDTRSRGFGRDLVDFIRDPLFGPDGGSFIELGCFPGTFMRLFAEQAKYSVSGLEYVESCAVRTTHLLAKEGIQADVHLGDFRCWQPDQRWDVVGSFGLIEHFDDTPEVLAHHIRLARPGGHVLVTFPLHCGLYGKIMRWASPDRLAQHNCMSLEHAIESARSLEDVEVVGGGHLGRFGFGACRLHNKLDSMFPGSRELLGLPLRALERVGRAVLPNSRSLSPFAALLLRRKPGASA